MLVLLIAVAFLFSLLTVEVTESEICWHFGPGLWTYRVSLNEIESVSVVRNRWCEARENFTVFVLVESRPVDVEELAGHEARERAR